MTESKGSKDPSNFKNIEQEVLRFLDSRGSIRAALLHKIEKHFCGQKSIINLRKEFLLSCLWQIAKDKKIEIIIPELFRVKWSQKKLTNLKYLKDGIYLCRKFPMIRNKLLKSILNNYYFDSRKRSFSELDQGIEYLKLILEKVRNFNKKIIIYNPLGSNPLDIYEEKAQFNYKLQKANFQIKQDNMIKEKLDIPSEDRAEALAVVQGYRSRYMCFYIPLIESILKTIEYIQVHKEDLSDYEKVLQDYTEKFAYNCIEFVKSDYIEIEPNPLRWESIFNYLDLPIKILEYDFKYIKFHGRTWENYQILKICIYIEKQKSSIIKKLKKLGYEEFPEENYDDLIAIGLNIEIYYPCSTIEHIYFLSKFICFYYLFLLFYHSFEYIKEVKPKIRFTKKEKSLYTKFLPVLTKLFNLNESESKVSRKLVFKYYTLDPDELEIIFNHFLIKRLKEIEKKLFYWWRYKTTLLKPA